MTRHIHADHMIAAANDTSIEWERLACNADGSFAWVHTLPKWLPDSKYRQKPAEVVVVDLWQWAIRYDSGSPIKAPDTFYDNEFSVKNDRPGYEIVCRIEGSKITVVSQ